MQHRVARVTSVRLGPVTVLRVWMEGESEKMVKMKEGKKRWLDFLALNWHFSEDYFWYQTASDQILSLTTSYTVKEFLK